MDNNLPTILIYFSAGKNYFDSLLIHFFLFFFFSWNFHLLTRTWSVTRLGEKFSNRIFRPADRLESQRACFPLEKKNRPCFQPENTSPFVLTWRTPEFSNPRWEAPLAEQKFGTITLSLGRSIFSWGSILKYFCLIKIINKKKGGLSIFLE